MHREMLRLGLQSTLCATSGQPPREPAQRVHEFRRIKPDFLYFSPEMKLRAKKVMSDVDVVHGHGFYVGTNYVFGGAARRMRKPLVYHVHGFFEPWILNRSQWKKKLALCFFENANFRHAKLWRALTLKEADQIRACGIAAPVVVAPNGLNLDDYARPANGSEAIATPLIPNLTKAARRLLFLGRLHPKKGLDILLTAWANLSSAHKDWELVVAGPDEGGYLAKLKTLAGSLGLNGQVRFTGMVTGNIKKRLLYSADLFVLPSYSEGFSMSVLEAMACEIPVVASKACNFSEITNHDTGWECEPTAEAVFETLDRALREDDAARRQRGQNGRRLVQTKYAWPSIVRTLSDACAAHCR